MLDRTKAPETYEIDAVNIQIAEVTSLSNGARMHVIKSETQPVVRLDFVFKAGKWYEGKKGTSDLAAKMLLEGSLNHTAKQIADKVAFYGASFESSNGYDRLEYTLYCLAKYTTELVPLVLDVLQNPAFPDNEFEHLKQRTIQSLKIQRQKNNYLSTHSFSQQVYGPEHPYTFGFNEGVLEAVTKEEVENFYRNRLITQELEVFACGAIDDVLQHYLQRELSTLRIQPAAASVAQPDHTITGAPDKTKIVQIEDSLQSSIRIGKRFPKIGHSDYQPLLVLNEVLGGYFGSRLMRNIREDKGYTYGIYSAVSPKEEDTLFYVGTDVNYAVTDSTIEETLKEIKLLREELIPEDELQTVKNYMLGKFLNDIATIFDQCDRYKRIVLFNLEQDHYNNFVTTIRTVTPPMLQQLANEYLREEDFYTSIAGRRD
ncbi:M16 family metallopeptidase [Pontibacter akesuensis]|uniref:Predicted Zn-dependent peptidase n=1 Tax=Pontibacter akesuensis TaxID=388950 RepID=A0A1I7KAB0_9BACT|nr:pitrilysin family protein [Pontibacter akesuensis]GHA73706.1 peptidase M16 [Pontibacter akesuensis]SFU94369.1 Predicted Zn-dependent peptidase [Pontibacter akesuensis]